MNFMSLTRLLSSSGLAIKSSIGSLLWIYCGKIYSQGTSGFFSQLTSIQVFRHSSGQVGSWHHPCLRFLLWQSLKNLQAQPHQKVKYILMWCYPSHLFHLQLFAEEIKLSPQALGLLSMLEGLEEKGEEWPKITGPQKTGRVCVVGAGPAGVHMALPKI